MATRKYRGKYPKNIRVVASSAKTRGVMIVVTNDGDEYTVTATMTGGATPRVGEPIAKYIDVDAVAARVDRATFSSAFVRFTASRSPRQLPVPRLSHHLPRHHGQLGRAGTRRRPVYHFQTSA